MNNAFEYDDHTNLCTKINNVCFLWIPKNCSSSFRSFSDFSLYTRVQPNDKVVVILRDPLARYISAIPTLIERRNKISEIKHTYLDFIGMDKDVIQDEHTTPQDTYLKEINFRNAEFYLYGKTVLEEINKKYKLWSANVPYENSTKESTSRLKVKKHIEKHLSENTQLINKIKSAYQDDYRLLDKHFPNWRINEHYLGITNYNTRPAYRKFQQNRNRDV